MRPEIEKALSLLQGREPEAVERALAMLQQSVFAFSMKVCGHREDAEDTMQEVLLKAVPHLPKFTNAKALVVWLYTVAKNSCLMSRRHSKFAPKHHLSLEELMPDGPELAKLSAIGPDRALLRQEDGDLVRRAILKVPPQYRLVLVLHDLEELDTAEVAKVTGLRPGTVRVRLHRARLFVKKELARAMGAGHRRTARKGRPAPSTECKRMFAALSDYLDEELPAETCDRIREHMSDCQPCVAFLANLQETVRGLKRLPARKPDARVAAKIRKTLLPQLTAALAQSSLRHSAAR
jgi:RNA polymerase sigma-70 factor (ECF subfamily)